MFVNQAIFKSFLKLNQRISMRYLSKIDSSSHPLLPNVTTNQFGEVCEIPVVDETQGVFQAAEVDDIKTLVNNFTAPALAFALRTRETTLHQAAELAKAGEYEKLNALLHPFLLENVKKRRIRNHSIDFTSTLTKKEIQIIQRYLYRQPRQIFQPALSRASVLIPLCNDDGVPSILFEKRSGKVKYQHQICFPGGMLDESVDKTIVQTSLRETEEEIGIPRDRVEVLGVLRCNWSEVAHITGIAVTPVVGFISEIRNITFNINFDEVEECFTIPVERVLDEKLWIHKKTASTPIFQDGEHVVWGLTAYVLDKFRQDILSHCSKQRRLPITYPSEIL